MVTILITLYCIIEICKRIELQSFQQQQQKQCEVTDVLIN